MNDKVEISILCLVYNHEKYLRRCLDGFVNQKTNFRFEVIVHDDCSKDHSADIIRDYCKKYPTLFVPILEDDNQMSKGINVTDDIMLPKARGKYIAFCEGDDYWNRNDKLQKQFEVMESDNDISLCAHNTIKHDLLGKRKDTLFNHWKTMHELTADEAFSEWKVHISSFLFRKEAFPYTNYLKSVWCGDYARLVYAFSKGKVIVLPDIMSVYNFNNSNGMLYQFNNNIEMTISNSYEKVRFLNDFDKYTNLKYHSFCYKEIKSWTFYNEWLKLKEGCLSGYTFHQYISTAKNILNNPLCSEYLKGLSLPQKIDRYIKFIFWAMTTLLKSKSIRDGH